MKSQVTSKLRIVPVLIGFEVEWVHDKSVVSVLHTHTGKSSLDFNISRIKRLRLMYNHTPAANTYTTTNQKLTEPKSFFTSFFKQRFVTEKELKYKWTKFANNWITVKKIKFNCENETAFGRCEGCLRTCSIFRNSPRIHFTSRAPFLFASLFSITLWNEKSVSICYWRLERFRRAQRPNSTTSVTSVQ